MKITVAGTGYVGLITGICLADKGHFVCCVDIDKEKISALNDGLSPIFEPGLNEILAANKSNIIFTTDYLSAYRDADVVFIGVGTPEKKDGSANLKYVYEAAAQIAESIENDCVVVIKSTVPIGTNDMIEKFIRQSLKHKVKINVASNPEFLSQGTGIYDTIHASRIVIGVENKETEKVMREVYRKFDVPIIVTNRRSAEMIKYASNDFLALKISYINEIANLCEIVDADIDAVAKGMGFDERIGKQFLKAGIGYGGSCFPKDTKALNWLAQYNDYELKTVKAAIEVNERQKLRLIRKSRAFYDSFENITVAVLGLTFKPGTDDLREAPSLVNIPILLDEGAIVQAWDPIGKDNFKKLFPDKIKYCDTALEALKGADICFVLTEWKEVIELTAENIKNLMNKPIILDGRNCMSESIMLDKDIIYRGIGRRKK